MKNKLPFIIIIIVFILGISISFLFKRKDSKGDYENDYISKILGLSPYSPIYIIKRLRFINQKPAMIETTHLSEAMFPELLRKFKENETQSLYALMKNDYNIIPTHHSYKVSMNICDIDNAVLLGIETNSPLLNFSIISKDSNNNVIEYCQSLRRIDRCCINASFKNY